MLKKSMSDNIQPPTNKSIRDSPSPRSIEEADIHILWPCQCFNFRHLYCEKQSWCKFEKNEQIFQQIKMRMNNFHKGDSTHALFFIKV